MNVFDVLREKLEQASNEIITGYFVRATEFKSKMLEIIDKTEQKYNNGWIPCSERLPEDTGEYIVTIDGATESTTLSYDEVFCNWTDDDCLEYPVIAWQPLPESYKGGE